MAGRTQSTPAEDMTPCPWGDPAVLHKSLESRPMIPRVLRDLPFRAVQWLELRKKIAKARRLESLALRCLMADQLVTR